MIANFIIDTPPSFVGNNNVMAALMSKTVRIPLAEPVPSHNGPITQIVLREPTYDEYVSCGGEPYSIGESEGGALFTIEKPDVIWAYAEACMVEPKDPLLLTQQSPGSWRNAREVRKAILGFFQGPAAATETSQTSPMTSSSNSISPSTPSDA